MADVEDPIVIMVQTDPSGRRTLAFSEGGSIFRQLDGDLCGNDNTASFYRAVAAYMGTLTSCGKRLFYTDAQD